MGYPAYPEYKGSGVEWFRNIPSDWTVHRLKMLASEPLKYGANEAAYLEDPSLPRFIRITDVNSDGSLNPDTFRSLPEKTAEPFLLEDGDILLARSGATVGKSFIYSPEWGKAAYAGYLIRLRTDRHILHKRFTYYFFQSSPYWANIDSELIQATIQNFSAEKYSVICIPKPDLDDQSAIAKFLDHKTAQIDSLIEKKQELIEKLQEQRIAAMTHAVTKGLRKLAPMRESGIDWLGDIPAHWDIRKLRFVLSKNFTNGLFKKAEFWGRGNKIINVFDVYIHNDVVNEDGLDSVECSEEEAAQYSAIHGDFFLVRSSLKLEGIGKSATVINPQDNLVFECHLVRGRPDLGLVDARFLNLFLNSKYAREYFISRANSVTMATIDQTKFKDLFIALPCKADQIEIVRTIDAQLSRLDSMVDKNKKAIERLQEYRTALITAAVTGQIDVRDWQAPASVEEAEPNKEVA